MSNRTEQIDDVVLGMIGDDPRAIADLIRRGSYGYRRPGTVRSALVRLLKAQLVKRRWDGNQRFGRYVYVRASSPLPFYFFH